MDVLGPWPFAVLLVGVAVLPLVVPHLWEHPVAPSLLVAACALPVCVAAAITGNLAPVGHALAEYVAFIALISALYVTAGGVRLSGNLRATPRTNTAFLAVGAVLASLVGTTGASMLLIRPLLDTNREREHKVHIIVFFIVLVSNVGGLLTPLGDPPLYLGYLRGVPFTFPMQLWPHWLVAVGMVLGLFYLWERRAYARESRDHVALDVAQAEPLRIEGRRNIVLSLCVVAISAVGVETPWRELALLGVIVASLRVTPRAIRDANAFHFGPLREVAILFAGIFTTMAPAIAWLEHAAPSMPVGSARGLFFMTGALSSVLDNAPTYLVFASLAAAGQGLGSDLAALAAQAPGLLAAVSLGAVFMGANTYIGNGPNLLVRAVAEDAGPSRVAMPGFLAYAAWAVAILSPVYAVIAWMMM